MALDLGLFESTIEHQVVYPHPRERVWRALTESDLLEAWLMENDLEEVEVGHTFELREDPVPFLWDGTVRCEVLAVDPPEELKISWEGGGKNPLTVVSWRLEPVEGGTQLTFTHEGFDGLRGAMMRMGLRGWKGKFEQSLPAVLDGLDDDRSTDVAGPDVASGPG